MPNNFFLFISIGTFHIELSFDKAVGKYLDNSGGPHFLVESGILASGSLRGFMEGKNYSRCRRVHSMFAIALQSLHFEAFLNQNSTTSKEEIKAFLTKLSSSESNNAKSLLQSIPVELDELYLQYHLYCKETLTGGHGPTAQYWMIYIKMIDDHRKLTRAVRTGDYMLYIQMLPQFIKLFFTFNHQNYARWLTKLVLYF